MCDEQSDLVPLSGQSSKGCTDHLSMPGKQEAEPQPSLRQYCSWMIRWPMMMWTSRLPRNRAICLAATKMVSTLAEAGEGGEDERVRRGPGEAGGGRPPGAPLFFFFINTTKQKKNPPKKAKRDYEHA